MTNSKLLLMINALRQEVDNQINLCSNISKLENTDAENVNSLLDATISQIDKLKKYQHIIAIRNNTYLTFRDEKLTAHEIIKRKEALLLKKKLMTPLVQLSGSNEQLIKTSLSAFQSIQEYKTILTEIHEILITFNNERFEIKDYNNG